MKIVFTVTNDLNFDQRMIRICSAFAEAGYECELVGRLLPQSIPIMERPYAQKRLRCRVNKGKLFYIEYNIRLFLYLLFRPVDVIWAVDCDTVSACFFMAAIRGKKRVFDAHELFTDVPEVTNRLLVKKIWGRVQAFAFRKAHLAITVGPELAKWFQHKYKRKVEVVKNVPSLDKQLPYRPDDNKFILYQGALNAGRGLENLILAMENIPCKLILAGDGDLTHELKQLANKGTAADRIEFLGRVAPEELPLLTSRAYIGVNISENAGLSYWLSLNNKFFDYAMAGLPQLVNPFPEYEAFNAIYEVGILTKSDAHIIAEQANLLLNAPDLHQQLHENCLRAAEKWNWEQEKKHLLRIFEDEFELG